MLQGKKIYLRCVKEEDLTDLHRFWKGKELISEHRFRLQFYETALWSEDLGVLLLMKEEIPIGAVWYEKNDPFQCLNLHFCIFKEEDRRQGYMTEALPLFARYLFSAKKIERVQVLVPDYNQIAIRLLRKSRFQFEGIVRKSYFSDGAYRDLCLYSALRKEVEKISV